MKHSVSTCNTLELNTPVNIEKNVIFQKNSLQLTDFLNMKNIHWYFVFVHQAKLQQFSEQNNREIVESGIRATKQNVHTYCIHKHSFANKISETFNKTKLKDNKACITIPTEDNTDK